jgi:branched-chain amino acid transport system substrate-binding protein
MGRRLRPLALLVLALAVAGCSGERAASPVKIGVLGACEGSYGFFAPAIFAGAELPLLRRGAALAGTKPEDGIEGAAVAGKRVELYFSCSDDSAERALSEARRLVEVVGVDVVIGPQFSGESFAIRDYARRQPGVTFVNGLAGGQSLTLHDPAPNFFRFYADPAQQMAGLGDYAYSELGWRRVVTIGDQSSFSYTQTAGFVAEFCALGGRIVETIWIPLGADPGPYVAQVPRDGVDGFLMAAEASTLLPFTEELPQLQGDVGELIIPGILVDPLVEVLGERLVGIVGAGPDLFTSSSPAWDAYLSDFDESFPDLAGYGATPFADSYYVAMQAILEALEAVDGDLSDGQRRFQAALAGIELDSPIGHIRLDERRQAIAPIYLFKLQTDAEGQLVWKPLRTVENVEQTFNGYFTPDDPPPGKDTIECKRGSPPPWTSAGG